MIGSNAPKRILVIEDNPGDQRLIQIKLAEGSAPRAAECVGTLSDALALAPFDNYDCVLADLGLPDASGLEAVMRLRAAAPELPLVVLTGLDDERVAQDAIRAGAQDYVVKSLAGLELLPRVIRHAIERQQGQVALAASHRTSQALLDASHDLALLLDSSGRIVTINAHACEYFGRPAAELIGRNFFDLLPPSVVEQRRDCLERALDTGRTVTFQDSDGLKWFTNRFLAVAGADAHDSRCAVFLRDITADRAAAANLAAAKEDADVANRAKTEFMARMSREIRAPLTDVIGFAEMISGEMMGPIQPAKYREFAEGIAASSAQILKLLDGITDLSMLEMAVRKDQTSSRDLVELSPDLICVCVDGVIERINAAGLGMLRAPSEAACLGKDFAEFLHPESQPLVEAGLDVLCNEDHPLPVKIITFAGRERDIELSAVPLRRDESKATLLVGRDTTEITAAMRAVAAREHRIRAIMDTVLDGIITIDESGVILNANLSVERIFGYRLSELIGANVSVLMPTADAAQHDGYIARYLGGGGGTIIGTGREVTAKRKDGSLLPVHMSVAELHIEKRRLFTGTIRDLSENKALAQRVAHLANHDPLTDLPNRNLLTERLTQALMAAQATGSHVAVLTVDLAGFTTINDSLGHEIGNQLLCEAGRRLAQMVGSNGTAARLGGDEFAVIIPHIRDETGITRAAESVLDALAWPYHLDGNELTVPADIGISVYPRNGDDALELLRNAETALHAVKKVPETRLGYFDTRMSSAVSERLALERSLKNALDFGDFELFYQPQLRLSDYSLVGAEALLRWRHRELGIIGPERFISVTEETGLIVPLGKWVLRTACAQLKAWQDSGLTTLRMGVNISGRQFREAGLVAHVASAIAEAQIDPKFLDLELTESILMADGKETLEVLRDLAKLGVQLSIDDFGTGYSSLAYLKRFPVHTVKIDRAFVRDLDHDDDDKVIAKAIISLAHSLSLRTIAEGVETEGQAALLAQNGCDEIQGYLIARPLPADEFLAFAINSTQTRRAHALAAAESADA
jgi:diguanylate cyclase (GGDEF)-like protein/PAS domain S-box-containing protein